MHPNISQPKNNRLAPFKPQKHAPDVSNEEVRKFFIPNSSFQIDLYASGIKMKKTVEGNTTEYTGSTVYKNGVLEFIHTPEGYMEPIADGYRYVYRLTDHLGNTRVSFVKNEVSEEIDVLETNDYYPFGLQHGKANAQAGSSNLGQQYKFGGKEYQPELGLDWYDVSARNYDPALGRWMNLDPLADFMKSESPYEYAFNNPIYYIDTDGRAPEESNIGGGLIDFFKKLFNRNKCKDCAKEINLDEVVVTGDASKTKDKETKRPTKDGVKVFGRGRPGAGIDDGIVTGKDVGSHSINITGLEFLPMSGIFELIDKIREWINNRNVVDDGQSSMETKPDKNEPVAPVPELEEHEYYTKGVNKSFYSSGGTKSNETPFRSGPFETRGEAENDSARKSTNTWIKSSSIGIVKQKKN